LGYAVANPELPKFFGKSSASLPCKRFFIRMGIKMLENMDIMRTAVSALKSERGKLIKALNQIEGVQAFDSQADFLFINTEKPADEVYEKLLKRGIMLKKWGKLAPIRQLFPRNCGFA
jgi:histidinol-phosphate aminotransferase